MQKNLLQEQPATHRALAAGVGIY